jgi:hypothetical protein
MKLASAVLIGVAVGCARERSAGRLDTAVALPSTSLVDSAQTPAVAGREGWNYQQAAVADLDADGIDERVVLTARVELVRGRPAWDDGQQWQVYIEEPDGTRTHIYAQFVQLGTVTLRVGADSTGAPASVILVEHLPDRLGVYEVTYTAPGRTTTRAAFERRLDPRGDQASPRLP